MDRFEKIMITFIILLFLSLSFAVIKTAYGIEENIKEIKQNRTRVHLPSICQPHYGNGADEWINCMEVGYK